MKIIEKIRKERLVKIMKYKKRMKIVGKRSDNSRKGSKKQIIVGYFGFRIERNC